ncbi:TIGR03013 family PEP-CTERM/XrtA system glycosyltransferase [Nitrogeniibacter mangrovi]|uniref:TIGR03013 family PEP-CTERM/XrtA system glycosyltransferase n=1 Tax=Nitrogeniibacter mangrovi TaxID=2016596 RepID=A0A6C1B7E9_9RHOO|nr:TIGR03013 family XrtA/PEP-CTERM system glycosyltransferase [Nitrogeniibacter mangrovi]QID18745.1 TIGR03013 family PEP-CTERM/XrtA system glycosyltransferase [Nitrogeniibacter mangrovi]
MLKIFSHYFPTHTLFQLIVDALILFVGVMAAVLLQSSDGIGAWRTVLPSALCFAIAMVVLNGATGFYRPVAGQRLKDVVARILVGVVVSIPVAYAVFSVLPWGEFASEAVEVSVVLVLGLILAVRAFSNRGPMSAVLTRRVLVLGTGAEAESVDRALHDPSLRGLRIIGFMPLGNDEPVAVNADQVFRGRELLDIIDQENVNEIIVAVRERRGGVLPLRELLDCKMRGVKVFDLSSFFERARGQVRIDSLRASWLIYGEGFRQGVTRTVVKRFFDLVASSVLLVLALPVMLVTAVAILLEDGGPIFYRQIRVGQNGRQFKVTKFRSMRTDAEKDGKPKWAIANDDRITRTGRLIRKLRIDELPQLFNVLMGDMSLVGPRPERPYFVDQLTSEIPFYAVRHCVKPGVTGWAQVRYQYGASVDDAVQKLQYDLYYVKNHTLLLDLVVLAETVRVVLTGEGAQ